MTYELEEELRKQFFSNCKKIEELLSDDTVLEEQMRQAVEKIFNLREKYKQVFFPELDKLIKDLTPFKERRKHEIKMKQIVCYQY